MKQGMFHAEGIVSGTLGDTVNFCSVEPITHSVESQILDTILNKLGYHNIHNIVHSYSVTANMAAYFL